MKKVLTCVGTRPNLIKITQLERCMREAGIEHKLLHTGQHFDHKMNKVFFEELGLPEPDVFLNAPKGSQFEVMAFIMTAMEEQLKAIQPDLVLVPGDVNSSMVCALVAQRMGIPVGHIESGLRSFDKSMPEEVNRIYIDQIASLFFVTEPSGLQHLKEEGFPEEAFHYTGNTMIDALVAFEQEIDERKISGTENLEEGAFALATFHRPGNVDNAQNLQQVVEILEELSQSMPVVFPVHPRTLQRLREYGLMPRMDKARISMLEPLGYLDFMHLIKKSKLILTDSGGVQEETTFLQVPCLTVRPNTERPVTIEEGTNTLVDLDREMIRKYTSQIIDGSYKQGKIPELWDGKATERLVEAVKGFLASQA